MRYALLHQLKDFLTEAYSLDMLGQKYAEGISQYYKPISKEEISGPAEEILRFLSERKNPMFEAHDLQIIMFIGN